MSRTQESMAVRDATCREIEEAFGRAGVASRYNRMPAMPCSSVVAWTAYGPGRQRRAVVTVDDGGVCQIFMSAVHSVGGDSTAEDRLGGLPAPLLCELQARTSRLGEEVLNRLRAADDETGPRSSWSDPDEARPAIRSAVDAAAAWALGDPFARDGFADDGNPLFEGEGDGTRAPVAMERDDSSMPTPSRRVSVDRWNAWAVAVALGLITTMVFGLWALGSAIH